MSSTQLSHVWTSKEPDELCDRPHKGFGKGYCGAAQVFNFLLFLGQMSASTDFDFALKVQGVPKKRGFNLRGFRIARFFVKFQSPE